MTAERLTRIEAILEGVVLAQDQTQRQIDSNARSIQAVAHAAAENTAGIADLRLSIADLRLSITDLVNMITTQALEAASDRSELRRLIEELYGNRHNGNGSSLDE